jgi:hypothetical protein
MSTFMASSYGSELAIKAPNGVPVVSVP